MIGQNNLYKDLADKIANGEFPPFAILVGEKGSGKKTIVRSIVNGIWLEDKSVQSVRKFMEMAYKVSNGYFIIPDADDMSLAAKNAMLKVVEECPNNNHFIMTLTSEYNTLNTIRSRAIVYQMERYTRDELMEYYKELVGSYDNAPLVCDMCETPGEIKLMVSYDAVKFYDYVQLVVENIAEVSMANAFKISNKIALKNEENKYDLFLFWKAFIRVCIAKMYTDNAEKFATWVTVTSKAIAQLKTTGINKGALFDMWVFDIRDNNGDFGS